MFLTAYDYLIVSMGVPFLAYIFATMYEKTCVRVPINDIISWAKRSSVWLLKK